MKNGVFLLFLLVFSRIICAQAGDPFQPDFSAPKIIPGMTLAWHDEFNTNGSPSPKNWKYENGFLRNRELQWYGNTNAVCKDGLLLIEARREQVANPNYKQGSTDWRTARPVASYTSSSINTRGLHHFKYGRFEIRARVDTAMGSWPAIWTLGISGGWPLNGEVDIMEFYRADSIPSILANIAWGRDSTGGPVWNTGTFPLAQFIKKDPRWPNKFHVWRMDWTADSIHLYIDDALLNSQALNTTLNPDGTNPFRQPHYLLLNLAIGSNGGDPSQTAFPIKYEVDYVRYYRK